MKIKIIFLALLFICCTSKTEKYSKSIEKSNKSINVDYVRIDNKYGAKYKGYNLKEITSLDKNCKTFIYIDTVAFKRIDTIKLYPDNQIFYNRTKLKIIDRKKLLIKKDTLTVYKLYCPHIGHASVDNYSGQIIYIDKKGIIARYGLASNFISLYKPELYSVLHYKILYRKINFKRDKEELDGNP